ncbi:peptide maturation system protein, TIGR04066 family [Sporobacter termitidis DSM 10068]|uniref:Peptide maturation system protein, TIGR04066 family n=1 Tax=Sporobacter termitidis DSM 10068 TaxID=1123282 RepID=A0A1M5ZFI7_9FIRM|nr:TIGR04066 family peptide maturation system protein [Sporobacter termitidis]SHI22949.1 peptide maturation system protein, TIGR04066 family [Sporobacter termitidis DSM 10068]
MEKEKIIVYPCSREFLPVLSAIIEYSDTYEVISVVTPKAWLEEGADAGTLDRRGPIGISVTNDFYAKLQECDTVVIPDSENAGLLADDIAQKMNDTLDHQKNIICCIPLDPAMAERLQKRADKQNTYFLYCRSETTGFSFSNRLYKPYTPVVCVGDMLTGLNAFDILVNLHEQMKQNGFRPLSISANVNSGILGHHFLPDFLQKPGLSEERKIFGFSHYIERLEEEYRPDILLVQIPQGMLKYSNRIPNGFGIRAFLMAQALFPDYFILCIPFEDYKGDCFGPLSDNFKHRFGYTIDAVALSNARINYSASNLQRRIELNYVNQEEVKKKAEELKRDSEVPVFCFSEKEAMAEALLRTLESYSEIAALNEPDE